MFLSQRQFDTAYYLLEHPQAPQRQIADAIGCSLGSVNACLKELAEASFVEDGSLTERGRQELEGYRINNAIILAAGMSSRFLPLSLERPKGLMVVKGETMIERQIRQLQEVGITDITVVVGYMKEKYFFLSEKYGVDIVENPEYNIKNNTSSLMLVLDRIQNTYICASDHYFTRNIFQPYSYHSDYTTTFVDGCTTDYAYTVDSKGRFNSFITHCDHEVALIGPCCLRGNDAAVFTKYLKEQYQHADACGKLWEEVLIGCLDAIEMYPRRIEDGVVYEFDNLDELRCFDDSYIDNLDSSIVDNICASLECCPSEVSRFEPMKVGLTNTSFKFTCKGSDYIYRYPGAQTDSFLSRKCEAEANRAAKELSIDKTLVAIDPDTGWKICSFIENCDYIDPYDREGDQREALRMLKLLHDQKLTGSWDLDFARGAQTYIDILRQQELYDFSPFEALQERMVRLSARIDEDGYEKVLCHNDTWYWNFLKDEKGQITLIDWEYAGNNYPAGDIADYTISLDFDDEAYMRLAADYEGHELSFEEQRFYHANLALCSWYWFVWAIFQEATGTVVDDMKMWFEKANHYLALSENMYGISNFEKE